MKRKLAAVLVATGLIASLAAPAHADTFYELGRVNADIFALNAADVADLPNGHKKVTQYRIFGSHQAEQFEAEIDCQGKQLRTTNRRVVRSDLSYVRDASFKPDWQKPDARAIGGILIDAVCTLPARPARLRTAEADSTAAYLRRSADEALAMYDASKRSIIVDQTAVGDCIFSKMPKEIAAEAVTKALEGRPPSQATGFIEQANRLGAECSGRPASQGDTAIVGAAMSIFQRFAMVSRLKDGKAIGEDHLAAAWNTAPAEIRAPLLQKAGMLHDPRVRAGDIAQADQQAAQQAVDALMNLPVLKARLDRLKHVNQQQKRAMVSMYYAALAMGETSEAQLKRVLN